MDKPWLRSLTSKTITKLGPGKKYTLDAHFHDAEIPMDARFNDGEIPHGVREEHVTC